MAAEAQSGPLIPGRIYQDEAFRVILRRLFFLWARQIGKSYEFGREGFNEMAEFKGRLITFLSASVSLGGELLLKEVQVWQTMLAKMQQAAEARGLQFTTNADGLDFDALCDIFEHSKLETKLWHDRTTCSRTRVIAPNPDTAVGWTGSIYFDEVGRAPNAQAVLEAIIPFMRSNPDFRFRLATTPPPDDKHYTFELFAPPAGLEFPINPKGNFYRSAAGIMVHRVDIDDAAAAGVKVFHPDTGKPITPAEDRALSFDRTAWDRNNKLSFLAGGTAAVSLAAIARAQGLGVGQCTGANITEEIAA
jgi:hypothetical protein